MARRVPLVIGFALSVITSCASDGPTGDNGGTDGAARDLLASFLTDQVAAGALAGTSGHRPARLGAGSQALLDAVIASQGPDRMVAIRVDPQALQRNPIVIRPADITFVVPPPASVAPSEERALELAGDVNDTQIQAGVQKLVDKMGDLGFTKAPLQTAIDDSEFHQEGAQSAGVMVPSDASAVSFPLDLTSTYGIFNFTAIVYDGHSHVVFKAPTSQDLRDGKVFVDNRLTTSGSTALHELIHVTLKQQGLESIDDDDDDVVANMEHALTSKINAELGRQATGTPNAMSLTEYSLFVGMVVTGGGEAGLKLLGLPGGAQNLQVTTPDQVGQGSSFTLTFTVKKTDGTALANEDVVVQVSGEAVDAGFKIVRTDANGAGSLTITALPMAGQIRLNTTVLGQSVRKNVAVVATQTRVSVAPPTGRIRVGGTTRLGATVESQSNQNVRWSSSNEGVATVGPDGTVTGVGPGTATITATSEADPTATGTATIDVISMSGTYGGMIFTIGGFLGHDPFVFNAGPAPGRGAQITLNLIGTSTITIGGLTGGPSQLPLLTGQLMPDGSFDVFGRGTVAGFPEVDVAGNGRVDSNATLNLDLHVGIDGEFPGGQPIDYRFLGTP